VWESAAGTWPELSPHTASDSGRFVIGMEECPEVGQPVVDCAVRQLLLLLQHHEVSQILWEGRAWVFLVSVFPDLECPSLFPKGLSAFLSLLFHLDSTVPVLGGYDTGWWPIYGFAGLTAFLVLGLAIGYLMGKLDAISKICFTALA
jgi:hypothetical protein